MKVCKTCGEDKPLELFSQRRAVCKACVNADTRSRMAVWRASEEGREATRAAVRKWKAANPEKVKAQHERKRRAQGISPRAAIPERISAADNAFDRRHVQALRMIRWGIRPEMTASEVWAARYRRDPKMQIRERMRTMMRKHAKRYAWMSSYFGSEAKRQGGSRIWHLVGYSAAELRSHLERQFANGMTWDRFLQGEIHIDHIVPKSRFDLDSIDEVRACYALSNLRPLWAADNVKAGARRSVLC